MIWFNKTSKALASFKDKDDKRQAKMLASQQALILAATETADAANDVTMLLKSKLHDSLLQIETTAKILPDALIICDKDGKIETVNPAAERIFKWSKEEFTNSYITSLFKSSKGESLTVDDFVDRTLFCNESEHDVSAMDCVKGKRKTGETFWVEVSVSPLKRASGTAMVILCRDATKRIELTQKLQENENKFRSIFEASLDGIAVVSSGAITTCNSVFATMLGLEMENLIATPFLEYTTEPHKEVIAKLENILAKEQDANRVLVIKLITGTDVLVSATTVTWGGHQAMLLTIKDLSFAL